jgi:tryptophan halogenase
MDQQYREILDYIVMMYYTSNRPEPFWRAAREDIVVPDTLLENLELWNHYLPNYDDVAGGSLFSTWNYYIILASKGYFDKDHYPGEGMLRKEPWEKRLHDAANQIPKLLKQLPSHRDYLNSLRQPEVKKSVSYSMNYQLS